MSAMSELHADVQRAKLIEERGALKVASSGERAVREAIRNVVWRAHEASDETDLLEMLRRLTDVRDACMDAADAIKAVVRETRDAAIAATEHRSVA